MSDPYCNFYVGQRVIYKPVQPKDYERMRQALSVGVLVNIPLHGQAYHIRALFMDTGLHRVGVRLVEIVNPPGQFIDGFMEPGFWHCDFRPATDISELEKLLAVQPRAVFVRRGDTLEPVR